MKPQSDVGLTLSGAPSDKKERKGITKRGPALTAALGKRFPDQKKFGRRRDRPNTHRAGRRSLKSPDQEGNQTEGRKAEQEEVWIPSPRTGGRGGIKGRGKYQEGFQTKGRE